MTAVAFEPGVYPDMDEALYHADPVPGGSLSSSGAKRLLPPSCPAKFAHEREHGRPPKTEFDFGHAAHKLILGKGAEIEVIRKTDRKTGEVTDAVDRKTDSAKEHEATIRAAGNVPMLAKDLEHAQAMEAAVRRHDIARYLFEDGRAEVSVFWPDPDTGVMRRARFDWVTTLGSGRSSIVDYKTCDDAGARAVGRSVWNYRYFGQDSWYRDGAEAVALVDDPAFLFVFQEKTAPYLIRVVELEPEYVAYGREQNRKALEVYRDCTAAGVWPGYDQDVTHISLPGWAAYTEDEA